MSRPSISHETGAPPPRAPGAAAELLVRVTRREEAVRDNAVGLVLRALPPWVTPGHLTRLRIVLTSGAVVLWLAGRPLGPVLGVFATAALTDLLDGPLARRRGVATAAGGRLDQVADAVMGGSLGIMVLINGLLDRYLVAVMVIPQALAALAQVARHGTLAERPTTVARLQFVMVLSGFWVALLGEAASAPTLVLTGRGLLYAEATLATARAVLHWGGWYPDSRS